MSKPRGVNVMIIGFASTIVVDAQYLSNMYRRTDYFYVYELTMPMPLHHLAITPLGTWNVHGWPAASKHSPKGSLVSEAPNAKRSYLGNNQH